MELWPAPAGSMVTLDKPGTPAPAQGGTAVQYHGGTTVPSSTTTTTATNGGTTQPPSATTNTAGDTEQAQFEADKRAVYKHPLFPLLALLFERCELATQSSETQSSDSFNLDIQAFVQHQERDRKPFLINDPEIDGLMIKAIQVLRIHLLELEKVQELCKDFCNRYITCLKGKMQSENLLRSDYSQGGGNLGAIENNNNMMNHSESGSNSNSPIQSYSISPSQQAIVRSQVSADLSDSPFVSGADPQSMIPSASTTDGIQAVNMAATNAAYNQQQAGYVGAAPASQTASYDNHIIHGSTPLSQIGVNVCPIPSDNSLLSGQLSPAPTTPGGSADDCDSDFTGRVSAGTHRKQKRGVLPKHATSVMRSWLFQHLVHPYPTEDEKRNIAAQTNLTLLQVNNWFINARRRILQPMLDASGPADNSNSQGSSQNGKKKHNGSSNKRFWPDNIASLQPQLTAGVLSSSDDDCDSYSSEGEDGSLVIDAANSINSASDSKSRLQIDATAFSSNQSSESEQQ